MEIKDVCYTVGILLTFIIGFLNYLVSIKNRRNFLRELIYKEQLNIVGKINSEFHILNTLLIRSLKARKKISYNEIEMKVLEIDNILYSNTHLLPTKIFNFWKEILVILDEFSNHFDNSDSKVLRECYDKFGDKYYTIIKLVVKDFGIDKLYLENKSILMNDY
ncbi:hypothetical protein [Flavobacterium hibisci]|uniref:hypothetical protein n=1 Tax=Flavobacterium hibisci TaxID=1914462 RepID=UPI001CC03D79|nr:hypothetical protein [Flavobacterium hibisci]MBZ4041338.1 hypothetical protein [Flavobacterium hibisci]